MYHNDKTVNGQNDGEFEMTRILLLMYFFFWNVTIHIGANNVDGSDGPPYMSCIG